MTEFVGAWTGTKRLYFEGADGPMVQSPSTLSAALVINGFLQAHYRWVYEGKPQEGLLLIGDDAKHGVVTASWVDTFHQSKRVLFCQGGRSAKGVSATGAYDAGEGPPWGWRIDLELAGEELRMTMFNISPEGNDDLAVAAAYRREP